MAFSRDGRTLTSGSDDGTVRLWDTSTGRTRTTLHGRDGSVDLGALSPDGRTLTIGKSGRVQLWDTSTGRMRIRIPLTGDKDIATPVLFSPDGRTLATFGTFGTAGGDNSVELWDTSTGRTRATLPGPPET
ncbi:WD40 repeat domain-containing protein [Streptomyces sp. NPDC055722]